MPKDITPFASTHLDKENVIMRVRSTVGTGIALASLLMWATPAPASVNDDQVTSQKIREADGTSGQNTNAGSGVKTNHIQDGAVTDAKISGVISAAKLPIGITTETVAAGDHNHDSVYQSKHANVIVVAKNGGDFTSPIAAANSIIDASEENPYLIKIMPGVYDIGAQTLFLPSNVDLEGSGNGSTSITGSAHPVLEISSSELRHLKIEGSQTMAPDSWTIRVNGGTARLADVIVKGYRNTFGVVSQDAEFMMKDSVIDLDAGGARTYGIIVQNGVNRTVDLDNVEIRITSAPSVAIGVLAEYGAGLVVFRNGKIDVNCAPSSGCIGIRTSGMTIRNSNIQSTSYGVYAQGTTIVGSTIVGGHYSLFADGNVAVSFSELDGPIHPGSGPGMNCFAVHDETFNAVTCP